MARIPYSKLHLCLTAGLLLLMTSGAKQKTSHPQKNMLAGETSPYLLQHKDNPIWWMPWGEEAFALAKKLDRPIFLSVGYSTCHWCHVMEGDSFEKADVAAILNKHFIAIKVDREERPDVDAVYMQALQAMSGSGGWPMSLILTPERQPFWAATFMPREQFKGVLTEVNKVWRSDQRKDILTNATRINEYLQKLSRSATKAQEFDDQLPAAFYTQARRTFDPVKGGFAKAPKFPPSMALMALLRTHKRSGEKKALAMVTKTLDEMIRGGIHDHLGGGFHRYATDENWFVPHFEKMLYDNALIAMALTEAYQVTQKKSYKLAAEGIFAYIAKTMTDKDGGFYSAEDADSEKTEGKFYVWQQAELKKILTKREYALIAKIYRTKKEGNFTVSKRVQKLEKAAGLKEVHAANIFALASKSPFPASSSADFLSAKEKLFKHRQQRIRPLLDNKILCSWNGLMIAALAKASVVFANKTYLNRAQKAAQFIQKSMYKDQRLKRSYRLGRTKQDGFLNDYAYFIFGLTELYQADFNGNWLELAINLQKTQDQLFWDAKGGGYFTTTGTDKTLISRQKIFTDNAIPAGNSMAALNLLRLADYTYYEPFSQKALQLLKTQALRIEKRPIAYPQLIQAYDYFLDRSKEIAIIPGKKPNNLEDFIARLMKNTYIPNKVIAVGSGVVLNKKTPLHQKLLAAKIAKKNKTTVYVCEQGICKLPTSDLKKAFQLANDHKTLKLNE